MFPSLIKFKGHTKKQIKLSYYVQMFTTAPLSRRWAVSLEEILKSKCPELSKNVVCIVDRKLYRPAPKHVPFLL